jgi:glutathione S-transferase
VENFFADFDSRLGEAPFAVGQRFSVADITVLVTVDFAVRATNFPVPDGHRYQCGADMARAIQTAKPSRAFLCCVYGGPAFRNPPERTAPRLSAA